MKPSEAGRKKKVELLRENQGAGKAARSPCSSVKEGKIHFRFIGAVFDGLV
ncbi:MAG: hypothetical protein PHT34_00390 [Oscillospiraceae bacterium]|nr:hypothetical protein [Oscillospiraceae bacterium]